jgi:hypothetical protein
MGSVALGTIALAIAGVVLVNVIAGILTQRFFLKADLTTESFFEISTETADILRTLNEPVNLIFLMNEVDARAQSSTNQVVELYEKYSALSGGNVALRFKDPDLNPNLKEDYNLASVARADTIVESTTTKRSKYISSSEYFTTDSSTGAVSGWQIEQKVTNAILYSVAERVPNVAFTTSHGESDYIVGLVTLKEMFTNSGFSLSEINLATTDISEDTEVLVLASPQTDFTAEEIAKLDAFSANAGQIIYLTYIENHALLSQWLSVHGIALEDQTVLDDVERWSHPINIIPTLTDHEIFEGINTSSTLVIQRARALSILFNERSATTVSSLFNSSRYSYGRTFDALTSSEVFDRQDDDVNGPFSIGAVSKTVSYVGTTAKISNIFVLPFTLVWDDVLGAQSFQNNDVTAALLRQLNPAVAGLVLTPKSLVATNFALTGVPGILTMLLLVVILPLGLLAFGLVYWLKRRRL